MDSKIMDPSNLLVNAGESQLLSYDMIFSDKEYQQGNEHSQNGNDNTAENRISEEEQQNKLQQLEREWQQKIEKAKKESYRQGRAEGRKEGKEEARELMENNIATVDELLVSVDNRINTLMDDLKPHVATMVFDVVEKVIGLPIESQTLKENVASQLKCILDSTEQNIKIKIEVAAADYAFISGALNDFPNISNLQITASDSLNSGEYSIDTPNERIVKHFHKMLDDFREKVALEYKAEQGAEQLC